MMMIWSSTDCFFYLRPGSDYLCNEGDVLAASSYGRWQWYLLAIQFQTTSIFLMVDMFQVWTASPGPDDDGLCWQFRFRVSSND